LVVDGLTTALILVTCGVLIVTALSRPSPKAPPPPSLPADPILIGDAPVLGDRAAPTAMVIFSDFQCPFCGKFATEILPQLQKEFVDTGRMLLVFKNYPLPIHKDAESSAIAAICAGEQGKFWQMHDQLFSDPTKLDPASVETHAMRIGVSAEEFKTCLTGSGRARVQEDTALATNLKVRSTPSVFVGTLLQGHSVKVLQYLSGARPVQSFRQVIDASLGSR
jgi:protein-disulfide isomerase